MKKILFITHDASLTGAPILLLNLLRILSEEKKYIIKVVIKNGYGNLISEFQKFDCLIWKQRRNNNLVKKIIKKIFKYDFSLNPLVNKTIRHWIKDSDIVFSNTITNGDFLSHFNIPENTELISYIHELQIATITYTTADDLNTLIKCSNRFVAPSVAVSEYISRSYGIPPPKIERLNYFIPNRAESIIHKASGISDFVIGLAGTLDWRKGADLLSVIVHGYFKKYPQSTIKFIWKGVDSEQIEAKRIKFELEKIGLSDKVQFESPSVEMASFYSKIDLFLLLSKEDPYPLVVLEAASYKKPCICFDRAGGAPEFVEDDAGTIVPYLDVEQMVDTMFLYYQKKDYLIQKGKVAYQKFREKHSNQKLIIDQFYEIISKN